MQDDRVRVTVAGGHTLSLSASLTTLAVCPVPVERALAQHCEVARTHPPAYVDRGIATYLVAKHLLTGLSSAAQSAREGTQFVKTISLPVHLKTLPAVLVWFTRPSNEDQHTSPCTSSIGGRMSSHHV